MKRFLVAATTALCASQPAFAADPSVGAQEWRQCRACHMITAPDGETVQRGGRVGPNLYGLIGRRAGSVEGFRYGEGLSAAGAAGLVWSEATLTAYLQGPDAFLQAQLGDAGAQSNMDAHTVTNPADMAAYLATFN
ncbi:c-type cytochrome [Roseicitreum antarcticum]|uniref:Cytochrome c n=1 Tax=Roseicitreum antarcticum TaxID=564137 RepID=A0A1H2SJN0_9RHOB|nr:cytochrome C [Roseicitreum antarcticum]SDW31841.1 cytochrome c [Roseicitreum antarcticum]